MFRTKPGEERALVAEWINRPALRSLVEAYGGTWPIGRLETVVASLVEFSEIWDYRAGKHDRHLFHDDQGDADPHAELTYWAAEALGMARSSPPSRQGYDYLLILGGLATGVEPRVRYAAQLIEGGLEVREQIAALGSFRPLQERELSVSAKHDPGARYEIDLLVSMLADLNSEPSSWVSKSTGEPDCNPASASFVTTVERVMGPNLAAYAAPSSDPQRRPANTADTYEFLAGFDLFGAGQCVLLLTSSIYVPYQHFDAVRILCRLGLEIETVGVRRSDASLHPAAAYRQELRSGFRSADRLLAVTGHNAS